MFQFPRRGIALLFLLAAALGACSTGEVLEVPKPETAEFERLELSAVYALSEDVIYLCGWMDRADGEIEGLILRSDDSGKHWRRVGADTFSMRGLMAQGLHFADARRGWVSGVRVTETGTNAVVLRTDNAGGLWRERTIAEPRAEFVSHLEGLVFKNDTEGQVDVVYVDEDSAELVANRYRSLDGGRHWVIDSFRDKVEEEVIDPAWHDLSEHQAYRLQSPDADGVQVLEFTATGGQSWRQISSFHISRFDELYGPWDFRADRAAAGDN
jgi:hypothetical protein